MNSIPQSIEPLGGTWIGRYRIADKSYRVNLGIGVVGLPPMPPETKGDELYEASKREAELKLDKIAGVTVSRLAKRKLAGLCSVVNSLVRKELNR